MRIDKFLVQAQVATRSQAHKLIKQKQVVVNDQVVKAFKQQIDENNDVVQVAGKVIHYQKYYYYLLNKPQGVITATKDAQHRTVVDLLAKDDYRADIVPVGRLDKDTTGLLLLTNDGQLNHNLMSPANHVAKEYEAVVAGPVDQTTSAQFAQGLVLRDGLKTQPAHLTIIQADPKQQASLVRVVIKEGKYHQVKRMFAVTGGRVVELKRVRLGSLQLDETALPQGQYRALTPAELAQLKQNN